MNDYLCGCYYRVDSTDYYIRFQKHYLPLLDSEAHSTILSTTSRTVLKQTFTNPSKQDAIKECIYTFPLYDGVSVVSFTCRIGKKVLHGLVKEKFKAKQLFDDAVAKGETAGLLEQAPEASDVFSTKLGNIPAGESVIVEITYIGELKHHETDGIRFTIPTKIAPRYGSGPGAAYTSLAAQPNSGIKVTVDVNMPEGSFIKGVQSPSHPIAVSMGTVSTATNADPLMSKASATLSLGSAALEKDFVLVVQAKDVGIPKAILETHPTIPGSRALMVTLVPKFSLPPSRPEIVFVADRSGSMAGNIEMLVSAMRVFLKSIPVGVKFNICSFGSTNKFLWKKSKSYTKETLDEATKHLSSFGADMGGTETFKAIKATIDRRFMDIPLEIMLLTDGDIWQQNELFAYVNQQVDKTNGKIRIFPLGIGSGVSHALIEGLARAGNGFAQAVQHGERLDNSVVKMLRGALSPHITDYTLEVKYEKEDDDFELIDSVIEGMKVLLSDDDSFTKSPKSEKKKPTISLFDTNMDIDTTPIKGTDSPYGHLPNVPTPKLLQAPHKIPSLFAFSRTSVYLLMSPETIQRNPTSVVLKATSAHGPLALEIPVEIMTASGETIHQLAVKKAVQDLEEGRGWIYDAEDQRGKLVKDRYPSCFDELVEKEAVRLGEKFQIAGKWTSFVAVNANEEEIAAKQAGVPLPLAEESYDPTIEDGARGRGMPAPHARRSGNYSPASPQFSPVSPAFSPTFPSRSASVSQYTPEGSPMQMQSASPFYRRSAGISISAMSTAPESQKSLFSAGSDNQKYQIDKLTQRGEHLQSLQDQSHSLAADARQFKRRGYGTSGFFGGVAASVGSMFGSTSQSQTSSAPVGGIMAGQGTGEPDYHGTTTHQSRSYDQGPPGALYSVQAQAQASYGGEPPPPPASRAPEIQGAERSVQQPGHHRRRARGTYSEEISTTPRQNSVVMSSQPQQLAAPLPTAAPASGAPIPLPSEGLFDSIVVMQDVDQGSTSTPNAKSKKQRTSLFSKAAPKSAPYSSTKSASRSSRSGAKKDYSPTLSSSAVNWTTASASEKVLALITLQDFEGSWSADNIKEIERIVGFEIGDGRKGGDQTLTITLVVVKYLEEKCPDEEGTWGLVVEKARMWLQGIGMDFAELERDVGEMVTSH